MLLVCYYVMINSIVWLLCD